MKMSRLFLLYFFLSLAPLISCNLKLAGDLPENSDDDSDSIGQITGTPSPGSEDIYSVANLNDLCVDEDECGAPYNTLPSGFFNRGNQNLSDENVCDFDYDPNDESSFVLNQVNGSVNGLRLLFSKEDLFFLAWSSVRYKINPYFLMGILSQESAGNCAAVSSSHGEGCFQITNTFGQGQLDDSYPDRVTNWNWSNRSGAYYPDDIFEDELTWFGQQPSTDQFRITIDPDAAEINDEEISSVVNFHFGVIASSLYFHWQPYLLYYQYDELRPAAEDLFENDNGKSLWQAAAYNGGAYGASNALADAGDDFLDEMSGQTQDYAPPVVDYCTEYQQGSLAYEAIYTMDDLRFIIDLLAQTYPDDVDVNWEAVKDDVEQVFFSDEDITTLTFVDDIKAIIYVISTHTSTLGPEWPDEDSI